MDRSLYTLHTDLEDHYWWFQAKNRIIRHLVRRFAPTPLSKSPIAVIQPGGNGTGNADPVVLKAPSVNARRTLADIGCGGGGLLSLLADEFDSKGVEMDEDTRLRARDRGLVVLPGHLPDAIPFEPSSFDVVIASEVIEHVADDRGAARRLAELVKPGGIVVCTVPAHQWLWSSHDVLNHHHRRYTPRSFRAIFDGTGLEVVVCSQAMCAMFPALAVLRFLKRALGMDKKVTAVTVRVPPAPINWILRWMFEAEKFVLPIVPLPMGSTVVAVLKKPDTSEPRGASPGRD